MAAAQLQPHHLHGSPAYALAKLGLLIVRAACSGGVVFGLYWQFTHPVIAELDRKRFGGSFEFLTVISAVLTVCVMALGFVATGVRSLRVTHMHWVAFLLPVETLITVFSWIMFIFYNDRMFSPDVRMIPAEAIFDVIHVCLHLFPLLGLVGDFVAHTAAYVYSPAQGAAIGGLTISYLVWLLVLRILNGRWTYYMLESFTFVQFVACFVGCNLLMFGTWLFLSWIAVRNRAGGASRGSKADDIV